MKAKRILVGIWLIGSLAWANCAFLYAFLYPTRWENVFTDPWFWMLSIALPSAILAGLLKGAFWIIARFQQGKWIPRRKRHRTSRRRSHARTAAASDARARAHRQARHADHTRSGASTHSRG
jgi:hypothetical protein